MSTTPEDLQRRDVLKTVAAGMAVYVGAMATVSRNELREMVGDVRRRRTRKGA